MSAVAGSVTAAKIGANFRQAEPRQGRLRRLRAHDARDRAPSAKADLHGRAVLGCRKEVTARAEEIADAAEEGEEPLGRMHRLEALHSPLPEASGLVRLLCTVRKSSRRTGCSAPRRVTRVTLPTEEVRLRKRRSQGSLRWLRLRRQMVGQTTLILPTRRCSRRRRSQRSSPPASHQPR